MLIGLLAGRVTEQRQLRQLRRIGGEIGSYIGTRDREAAEREACLIALTQTLSRLTWALLLVALVTVVVAVVALARS